MANNNNLKRPTPAEARELGRKGGIKSGKVRAQRKLFRELFDSYLAKEITDEQLREKMKAFGFNDNELINKNAVLFAQFGEALKGSTTAFIAIRDTIGEKPIEKQEVKQIETKWFKE